MHEGYSGQSSATLTLADVAGTRRPPTACRSTPRLELIEQLVYGVVCMRRDFSRIRRQIGKLRGSQMSLIGAETCRMNAAYALSLCVAGLRGQLRKLPFCVCMLRRLGPSSSRGSSWLGGLFWGAEEPCRRQVRLARRRADSAVRPRGLDCVEVSTSRWLRFLRVGRQALSHCRVAPGWYLLA